VNKKNFNPSLAFLTYTASAMFLHTWVAGGISIAVLGAAFHRRVRYEEAQLINTLGQDYQAYRQTVPCFFPWKHVLNGFK
jgi:protein-S-isoprenylcysteine O-methyltransferase Ste14